MLALAVLAAVYNLTFTAPTFTADRSQRVVLSHGEVWGQRVHALHDSLLTTVSLVGKEGQKVPVSVTLTGPWFLSVKTFTQAGWASRKGNRTLVGDPVQTGVGVPQPPARRGGSYDLQGRRVRPKPSDRWRVRGRDTLVIR